MERISLVHVALLRLANCHLYSHVGCAESRNKRVCAQGALRFLLCVRAQAVPKAVNNVYPADMSPTRLSNTDSCGSCPWRTVFVVTMRLCQSLAPDLGSRVILMAPEHHMEVHKERDGCFCFATLALGFTVQVCFGLQNCRGHAFAGCQEGFSHHLNRVGHCSLLSLFMFGRSIHTWRRGGRPLMEV